VEPKEYIDKLWGKQRIKDEDTYRMMHYVFRVDYDGKVLLHNVVTGRLVVLDQEEAEILEDLPKAYKPVMEQLVGWHYLVPESCDEHQQVFGMRAVLRKLDAVQKDPAITTYTILPTTACNARCYYCFEHGVETVSMTEQTANDVIEYISTHCGNEKKVFISWFGGEPTVASKRIDQISEGLRNNGINYWCDMTTNGYLFDENMVNRAVNLWNLKSAMITVDGTEEKYNKIKAYVGAEGSPYQKVIRNIGLLIEKEIHVNVRMNYDLDNYKDFPALLKDLGTLFKGNSYLHVRCHPVNGEYADKTGVVHHGRDEWFDRTTVELNNLARSKGLLRNTDQLPFLRYEGCEANRDSTVTITPQGMLVRCPEQFGVDQFTGSVKEGITHPERVQSWKQFEEYEKCERCILYPRCNRLSNCSAKDRCNFYSELFLRFQETAKKKYDEWNTSCTLINKEEEL